MFGTWFERNEKQVWYPRLITARITKIPEGEAPLDIRAQWVGIILQGASFNNGLPLGGYAEGVLTQQKLEVQPESGIMVLTDVAIQVLRDANKSAYRWWQEYLDHNGSEILIFRSDWYEVIDN